MGATATRDDDVVRGSVRGSAEGSASSGQHHMPGTKVDR